MALDDTGAPHLAADVCGVIDVGSGPISAGPSTDMCTTFVGRPAPP